MNFPNREIQIHLFFSGFEIKHFRVFLQNVVFRFSSRIKKKNSLVCFVKNPNFHREYSDYDSHLSLRACEQSQSSLTGILFLQAECLLFLFSYFSYSQVELISLDTECCLNRGTHHHILPSTKWWKISLRKEL